MNKGRQDGRLGIVRFGGMVVLVLALLLVGSISTPQVRAQISDEPTAAADAATYTRQVTVSGTGTTEAMPDRAMVTIGVQTDAETAGDALTENNQQMQDVIDALTEAGIDENDIQTQTIELSPRYQEPTRTQNQTQGTPELIGFTATNLVEVTVTDIDTLGEVLDAAVEAGGNRIQGISFEVADRSTLMSDAREAAWNDAEQKAQQLADLAGADLGPVLTISATGTGPGPLIQRNFAVEQPAAAAVPIQPGTQTLQVDLQVTWALVAP